MISNDFFQLLHDHDYLNVTQYITMLCAITRCPFHWLQGLELHVTSWDPEIESTFIHSNPLFKILQHFSCLVFEG